MKSLNAILVAGCLFASTFAMAAECVDKNGKDIYNQPDVFQELISKSANCYEAVQLAEACAYGASMDVYTTALASDVCMIELGKHSPKQEDLSLLDTMHARCNAHFDEDGGTLARSATAFCHLSAVQFVVNLVN
ncbi:hypothetical protein [Bdellovibrio sp. HCB337]|uniref:hypothetical protein n=1 Tax=Bdellovibrio sp. HCB337 TaxID=3394358 RepID=UPI0039A69893